jgi:zinc/manganese transport system substrate-binding protein/manganese/iron transport system substrate-binding protein
MISPRRAKRLSLNVLGGVALLVLAVALSACAPNGGASASPIGSGGSAGAALKVVTTTTVFADIVRNVGGGRVAVSSIIPPGTGPEDYEPKPDDAKKLAGADLVVSNGVGLDDFLDRLVQAAGEGQVPRLVLGDGIPTITVDGEANPHFWLDPSLVTAHYLPAITTKLSELDPADKAAFEANSAAYAVKVQAMDDANKAAIATLPAENRKLVTFHDAYPYFARHYGFELIGVIVANVGQEPSASDLAKLVQTVRAAHVNAVFSESQFSPKLAETLAAEAGVQHVVTTLYNDTLGPAPADTYLGMMTFDVEEIVKALS